MAVCTRSFFGVFLLAGPAWAQGNSQGHGHGKGHDKHHDDDDRDDQGAYRYEKQLVRNGTLPPGLQKRLSPVPVELERRLPPPPPDCAHVLISGHIVLLNRKTNVIVDVFAF